MPQDEPRESPTRWDLQIHQDAFDELLALGRSRASRIRDKLEALTEDPFRGRPGVDVKKLKAVPGGGLYRLRVGPHRVVYAVITDDRSIFVLVVAERESGYGRLMETAEARL